MVSDFNLMPKKITVVELRRANIGEDYWGVDFSNYSGPETALKRTVKYLKDLPDMKEQGLGILYAGPHGSGKTTLAMITMKYLIRAHWNVYCTSLGEIVERIQASWNQPKDDDWGGDFIQRCRNADFLFIDDVGKEHRGASGFVQTVFDNLIRFRMQHRLPTFLTTNHTKDELEATYGASIISLLEGKTVPVTVNGEDHRRTVQRSKTRRAV